MKAHPQLRKIVWVPRKSQLGNYPMTFMKRTLHLPNLQQAPRLLRAENRVKVLRRLDDTAAEEQEEKGDTRAGKPNWSAFMDVSASSLILLA